MINANTSIRELMQSLTAMLEPDELVDIPELDEWLADCRVIKKSGVKVPYNRNKIIEACNKSAARARNGGELTAKEGSRLCTMIENYLYRSESLDVSTATLHSLVENYLPLIAPDVGTAYYNYHNYRINAAKSWDKIKGKCTILTSSASDENAQMLKAQNANADSTQVSTIKCFYADYTGEELYEYIFVTTEEREAFTDGYIYIHDRNMRLYSPVNCCLSRAGYLLKHGFELNGIWYNMPKSLDVAFDVLGDLILSASSQQYGGFTVPRIDTILVPYAEMSYQKYLEKYTKLGIDKETAEAEAYADVKNDMYQGFQGLEIKLNTVASSRGDYPFTTFTLGIDGSRWGKMASIACLDVRRGGQGEPGKKKPVLFPKLVFLYDKNLHGRNGALADVFDAAIKCSSKACYPDYLSLTGEGYIASMYKKYGIDGVISPMGCRAFLSPYYERGGFEPADENDKPVYEGRFNLGAISLNLPMILAKARHEGKDFYKVLDYYLELIRGIHLRTYEAIANMKACRNPLGFMYGGFYGGHLKADDDIRPVLKSATMSFGVTALNELQELYNGKSLVEDGQFSLEVMKYINQKINEYKKQDDILYAIYGTPAESLCVKQVKQFREKYGIIKGVSDRDYVSNSFHCHVTEKISPIQKQDLEYRFWELFNGGKIQYVRYPLGYNEEAIRSLVERAMEMGFYEGVNISLDFCDDCGYSQAEMGVRCPKCGSVHITQIDRMNGYLSYTRVGRDTVVETDDAGNEVIKIHSRFNPGKLKEIQERVSM